MSVYSGTFVTPTSSPFNDSPSAISDAPLHATCRHSNFSIDFYPTIPTEATFPVHRMFLVTSKLPILFIKSYLFVTK